MLQFIRDRAQGILIWTIVGLIIITFALFGLSSYLTDSPKINVATVNGVEISQAEFTRAYQNYLQRIQQQLGENYRPELFNEEMIKKGVLDALITQEVLNQKLADEGYIASPEQIMGQIAGMKVFQDIEGRFSAERYKQILGSQRVNSFEFEYQVGRDLAEQQLKAGIMASGFVTDDEIKKFAQITEQQRKFEYLILPQSQYLDKVELSETDIDEYYQTHKNEFMTEEKVSVKYVELKLEDLAKNYDVSDEEIAQYYEQHKANYIQQPGQRKASHILVKVDENTDDAAAKEKIKEIQSKLNAGESFEQLAKEYSDDIGSAGQGGDLGFFGRGVMDKAFEEAVFNLNKDEVSDPVRSRFGYHLIKLEDVKEQQVSNLEEVKNSIKRDLQLQQAEQSFYSTVDRLNNLSYEIPDSLSPIAEELGLELKTSTPFSRNGGQGLFSNNKVVDAAFSEEVLEQGRNSQLLEISDTHVMVLRVDEHIPSKQLEKQAVLSIIENNLKSQGAMERLEEDKVKILESLKTGDSPQAVVEVYGLNWKDPGYVSRMNNSSNGELNPQIQEQVFSMPKPEEGEKKFSSVSLLDGDIAILMLHAVKEGAPFTDDKKPVEKRKFIQLYTSAEQASLIDELRKSADITRNMDAIQ